MSVISEAASTLGDSLPVRLLVVLVAVAGLTFVPVEAVTGAAEVRDHVTGPGEACHPSCGTVLREICCTEPIG